MKTSFDFRINAAAVAVLLTFIICSLGNEPGADYPEQELFTPEFTAYLEAYAGDAGSADGTSVTLLAQVQPEDACDAE